MMLAIMIVLSCSSLNVSFPTWLWVLTWGFAFLEIYINLPKVEPEVKE